MQAGQLFIAYMETLRKEYPVSVCKCVFMSECVSIMSECVCSE